MTSTCEVCNVPATQCCSSCNSTYYCSRDHQKLHWKKGHKFQCAPFKTEENETLGRHLVATRDIKEGEVVMKKNPLVLAPKMASYPMCLGCHKRLIPQERIKEETCAEIIPEDNNDPFYLCRKCHWPLCDATCEDMEDHVQECKVFSKSGFIPTITNNGSKQSAYASIGPIRALLLRNTSSYKHTLLWNMQNHLEENLKTPVYQILKATVVPFIKNVLKLNFSETEILRACSIFDTNSFDVRDTTGFVNVRGLYPIVNYMAHDCRQNTKHSFHGDSKHQGDTKYPHQKDTFQMHVIATCSIAKGDLITLTYTQTLWGTLSRRLHLKKAKNFDCSCKRCSDPTELGTYAGSIFCSECMHINKQGNNWIIEQDDCPKMISTDPLNNNAHWRCQKCDHQIGARQMLWGNEAIRSDIARIDKGSPYGFEDFLQKYKGTLHSRNYHVLEVKYALSQIYGNMEGYYLTDLSDEVLERKINICNELLEVSEILEPGLSKFRGSIMFDLQAALVVQTKREYEADKITKEAAKDNLEDALQILNESARILSTEPGMKEILQKRLENLVSILDFD